MHREHEEVRWLWEVVHGLTLEQKRQFLQFTTGSDRWAGGDQASSWESLHGSLQDTWRCSRRATNALDSPASSLFAGPQWAVWPSCRC